jgi:uncharacterized membrane protein HdeD (DUF308 family)
MGKVRYFLAVSSLVLGVLVLGFTLLQPSRPTLGIVFGVLLILNGIIRLYIGRAG